MTLDPRSLQELNLLIQRDPEKARAVFAAHPELSQVVLGELRKEELAARVRARRILFCAALGSRS